MTQPDVAAEVSRVVKDNWSIDVPLGAGFHRFFNSKSGIPGLATDVDGHLRIGGKERDATEYSDQMPIPFSWPGIMYHDMIHFVWGPILRTTGISPNEARKKP